MLVNAAISGQELRYQFLLLLCKLMASYIGLSSVWITPLQIYPAGKEKNDGIFYSLCFWTGKCLCIHHLLHDRPKHLLQDPNFSTASNFSTGFSSLKHLQKMIFSLCFSSLRISSFHTSILLLWLFTHSQRI